MKKTGLPPDFKVSQRIMQLAQQNNWPDPRKELEAFKDYHLAHGSVMADWEAAFRTWLRNAIQWRKSPPMAGPPTREGVIRKRREEQLTPEQRRENQRRWKELIDATGKGIK